MFLNTGYFKWLPQICILICILWELQTVCATIDPYDEKVAGGRNVAPFSDIKFKVHIKLRWEIILQDLK